MLSFAKAASRVPGVQAQTTCPMGTPCGSPGDEQDKRFIRLLQDCRPHGGLAREAEIDARRALLRGAHWHHERVPVRVPWAGGLWLPVIQFEPSTLSVRTACEIALAELAGVYDAWRLAEWLVQPNDWLAGACPAERIDDTAALRAAARVARFIAVG